MKSVINNMGVATPISNKKANYFKWESFSDKACKDIRSWAESLGDKPSNIFILNYSNPSFEIRTKTGILRVPDNSIILRNYKGKYSHLSFEDFNDMYRVETPEDLDKDKELYPNVFDKKNFMNIIPMRDFREEWYLGDILPDDGTGYFYKEGKYSKLTLDDVSIEDPRFFGATHIYWCNK